MASAFFSAFFYLVLGGQFPSLGSAFLKRRACGAFSLRKCTVKNFSAPAAPKMASAFFFSAFFILVLGGQFAILASAFFF